MRRSEEAVHESFIDPLAPLQPRSHPLAPLDDVEARVLARDLVLADLYDLPPNAGKVWLMTRARARRDLLWLCRNLLGLTRLSEEKHRPAARVLMKWMKTPHGFGSFRDPRGNGKSSLATRGGPIWGLVQDPIECVERGWPMRGKESRFGVAALKMDMTFEFMRALLKDLAGEKLRWAFPELIPEVPRRWSIKGVEVRRGLDGELEGLRDHPLWQGYPGLDEAEAVDPSIAPRALESGVAGPHSNGEFIDDPVNSKTWNSEVNILNAVHGIRQTFNVTRTEQGFRIVIGNHWCPGDVSDTLDREGAKWEVFMRSATACEECRDGYPTDASGLVPRRPDGQWEHEHRGVDGESLRKFVWLMPEADNREIDFDGLARIYSGCETKHIAMAQYENSPLAAEATLWASRELPRFRYVGMTRAEEEPRAEWRIEYLDVATREVVQEKISELPVGIVFDPSHGSTSAGASDNACVVAARTPADSLAVLEAWSFKAGDPLDAVDALIETIWRWRRARLKVGVESVGFQKVLKPLLDRELSAPRTRCCFVRPERAKRTWCRAHDASPSAVARQSCGVGPEDVVEIRRSRAEGEKEGYIRESLAPLMKARAIWLPSEGWGGEAVALAIDVFPVRVMDLADALGMVPHLFEGRAPRRRVERERRKRLAAWKARERVKRQGPAGYGRWK